MAIILLVVLLMFSLTLSANAVANKIGNYVLNGGVGSWGSYNRNFYITSSASTYATTIQNAINSWIYTTDRLGVSTSISWARTYTQSSSVMDLYYGQYFSSGVLAGTTFWLFQVNVDPTTQNWGWGKIQLNQSTTSTGGYNNLTPYNRQGTAAHEIGHVFGLDETNTDKTSIMCQLGSGRTVNQSQIGDLTPIQQMYP